eukprot:gene30503-37731_t
MVPSVYTESGGLYLGVDQEVHNVTAERIAKYGDSIATSPQSYHFFSDLSLWDTFRTLHPWLLLLNEDLAVGIVRSLAEITIQQEAFPRWMLGNFESSCMFANHGAAVVLEAILAGFGDQFDVKTVQQALLRQSTKEVKLNGRYDVNHYVNEGFVRQDVYDKSAGETLSYAFDDYVLSQISQYVENGTLACPIDPISQDAWQAWREGNSMHYKFFVPHDGPGMVALYPSPE